VSQLEPGSPTADLGASTAMQSLSAGLVNHPWDFNEFSLEKDFISTYSSESPVYAYAGSLAVASTATRFASSVACFHTLLSILYLVNRVILVSASDIIAPIDLNQNRQHDIKSLNL